MNLAEAEALLSELAAGIDHLDTVVGLSGKSPHTVAYLRLSKRSDPDTFATVSTPGVGTFELEVTGGFSTGNADDQATDDDDVRQYVSSYLDAAVAYVDGRWSIRKSRFFRIPVVTVFATSGALNLAPRGWPSINTDRSRKRRLADKDS
jgi:hypothetical protein